MYRILDLLTPQEIEECRKIAAAAPFVHGRITNPHNAAKDNEQLHEQQAQRMRSAGDAAALRADRLRLVQELAEVRAKASELAEQQRRASRRIDQAMARIRRILGE